MAVGTSDSASSFSSIRLLLIISASAVVYLLCLAIYRLFFHPLAKFPGPKYAAITHWYQFYFDVVKVGRFPWEIERMHKAYGPIVRIGPNEVHIVDPEFYHVLYVSGSQKRNKDHFIYDGFGQPDALLETGDHDLHRMRRAALNPFFSTQAISRMGSVVHDKLERLCAKLEEAKGREEVVEVEAAAMSMTTDIITEYCFGRSYNFLEKPGFAPEWSKMMMGAAGFSNFGRYFPWLPIMMEKLPPSVIGLIDASILPLVIFIKDQEQQVKDVKKNSGTFPKENSKQSISIINELLESDIPESEKTVKKVAGVAATLVSAGSTTTVHFLKTTIFFILADANIHAKLKAELQQAMPDPQQIPSLSTLEQLPYLSAVVKEGGRFTHGVSSRLARVAPGQDFRFGEWVLPAGTTISMTHVLQHNNPDVFPDSTAFRPERWLDNQKLDRHLVNFSRGARGCIGTNLAKVEMYLTLAALFRRFDFELFETDRSDVDLAHDFTIPYARMDSKGMRVLVKPLKT